MPIDIATGNVELARDDFVLPGRVPIKWTRLYRSSLLTDKSSPIGPGWTTSWFATLKRVDQAWQFSYEGVVNSFPDPDGLLDKGQVVRLLGAFLELVRENDAYIVTSWDAESEEIKRFIFRAQRGIADLVLIAVENVSGDGVELTWDTARRLSGLRQRTENRTILLNYSPAGLVGSLDLVMREGGRTELVRYEYDESGRFLAAFDRRDLANRYEYDAQARLSREMLKDGAVYSYRYDNRGRCIHFSGLDHYNEKRLRFLESANRTMVTNSYGKTTVYEHLSSGQVTSELDPLGNQRRTEFDEWGRTVAKIDPLGGTTRYTYDEEGNRDSSADPLGNTYRFTFNTRHLPVSLTNPLGKTWRREYDRKHRLVVTSNPLGARWKIDYDEANNPVAVTDPLGAARMQRFSDGLVQEMTDWMGHITRFKWDIFGRVTERVGPTGERTVFGYDLGGNPSQVGFPDGSRLNASYDSGENLSSFTNAKGQITQFRYGSCRRLLERVDPLGRCVRYLWGTEPEQLNSVKNEKGESFTYFRNDLGGIVREHSFDGREQSFEYDAVGRRAAVTNGNGEKIQLKRDAAGRLSEVSLPDGAVTHYKYDPAGRITAAINPDVSVLFEYDDAGQLVCENQSGRWVRTYHNVAGQVVRTATSLGHDVHYELDPNGRVTKLSTLNRQSISFQHDARGLEIFRAVPGVMQLEQQFDSMGRLIEQRVGRATSSGSSSMGSQLILARDEIIKRRYRYDADGLLLSISDGCWGVTDYAYDPAERLLNALRGLESNERFEYDDTDNLTRLTQEDGEAVYSACGYALGNRLLTRGDKRYEYDAAGQLLRKTESGKTAHHCVWKYTWDAQGQLRKICRPDGQEWDYKYDAFGRRVSKRGPAGGSDFLWDGNVIMQELPHAGGDAVAWITKRGNYAPLAKVQDGALYPIITDHLGTPREMLNPSGKLVWAASFLAWGQIDRKQNLRPEQDCPIRFQGQWFDQESGLHYNRFRYFDPSVGRFISQDPVRLEGGLNLYAYAPNPTGWIDPLGLAECGDKAKVEELDPDEIRFSQNTAGGRGRADALRASMGEQGWAGDPVDAVRTPDGVTTVDNTRVAVARELGMDKIPVTVHPPDEPLPPEMQGRFGDATTWGGALTQRTGSQRPPLPPTGTLDAPRMPAPKN